MTGRGRRLRSIAAAGAAVGTLALAASAESEERTRTVVVATAEPACDRPERPGCISQEETYRAYAALPVCRAAVLDYAERMRRYGSCLGRPSPTGEPLPDETAEQAAAAMHEANRAIEEFLCRIAGRGTCAP